MASAEVPLPCDVVFGLVAPASTTESVLVGWVSSAWWVVGVSPDAFAWPDDTGSTPNPPIIAMRVTASDAPAAPIRA